MKRIFLIALTVLILSTGICSADKATTYTDVEDEYIRIDFNVLKIVGEQEYYIPLFAQMKGKAITSDGGRRKVLITKEIGELSETKLTKSELKAMLILKTVAVQNKLCDLYDEFWDEALSEAVD